MGFPNSNNLSGTIPARINMLSNLQLIQLVNEPALTGTLPLELTQLTQLAQTALYFNQLSGTVPSELGKLPLAGIGLSANRISGTVPAELGSLSSLASLGMYSNRLSGTLPAQMGSMSSLAVIDLAHNHLTGWLPSEVKSLTSMAFIFLYNNALSGSLPSGLASMTALIGLLAQNNRIEAQIPPLPTEGLRVVLLHNNRLKGTMPLLGPFRNLDSLTLFRNDVKGRIQLPKYNNMSSLFLYDNRLSCEIQGTDTSVLAGDTNLVLPGNMITDPAPSWASMREVSFLVASKNAWIEFEYLIFEICLGLLLLTTTLAVLACREHGREREQRSACAVLRGIFVFQPEHHVEVLQVYSSGLLSLASVVWLPILLPLYYTGGNYFECGKDWLYFTIAYLADDPAIEWGCAVAACGFAACCVLSIFALSNKVCRNMPTDQDAEDLLTVSQVACMVLVWLLLVCLFGTPSVLYVLSTSIPPDQNVFGLSAFALRAFEACAGGFLFLMSAYAIPAAAGLLTTCVTGRAHMLCEMRLVMFARLMVVIVIPFIAVLLLTQACFGYWIKMWTPCADNPTSFFTSVTVFVAGNTTARITQGTLDIPVTTHNEICDPMFGPAEKCPRAVIDTLGSLVVNKLAFAAFLAPVVALFATSPLAQKIKFFIGTTVFRITDYKPSKSISREIAGVVMLKEYALSLGFCVPVLIPAWDATEHVGCLWGSASVGAQVQVGRVSAREQAAVS
eukprot:TRINITY_DN38660_c0_g1_i1.p1 TRINITY_DN38660_c0_g1~~TRINITY_DN38660_c0_g1_i1.p1  ORF type:complete len:731 (+),score=135.56 TRINITY_DN38660_c0_g1_i1:262-2454(+)